MVEDPGEHSEIDEQAPYSRRRGRWRKFGWAGAAIALLLALAWFNRAAIVDRIISGQLSSLGLPGKYRLESAGLGTQVLSDIVIGDPAHPDLTIARAEIVIVPTFGFPTVGKVTLLRPRLYGTVRQARASFGSLDKLLFGKAEKPRGLPDMELVLIDGRARLDTDYGPVGIKADGRGNLNDGFSGFVAAVAPRLGFGACQIDRAAIYGKVAVIAARPQFSGPLRLGVVTCPDQQLRLARADLQLGLSAAQAFDSFRGGAELNGSGLDWHGARLGKLAGRADFSFAAGDLTARYRIGGEQLDAGYAAAAALQAEGFVRSRDRGARIESDGTLAGRELSVGAQLDRLLSGLVQSDAGTLVAPLAAQIRDGLAHEARNSRFAATYTLRTGANGYALTIPRAAVRGASGADLFALSRFQLAAENAQTPRLSGSIATGGAGLPRFAGTIQRSPDGRAGARFAMAEYRAGSARIALPLLTLAQTAGGEIGFSGRAELSGPLPGGAVEGLIVPLDGNWSSRRGLAAWRRCITPAFQRLTLGSMALDARQIRLCPGSAGAILRSDARGLRIAAGTGPLALTGQMQGAPVRIATGPLGLAWPGAIVARSLSVELGAAGPGQTRFKLAALHGRLGDTFNGTFAGAQAMLGAVPLDVLDAAGTWQVADGTLTLGNATFRLQDRQRDARFRPLIARGAHLHLHLRGTALTAEALLREPGSDRPVVRANIVHDLGRGTGHADLSVPGLVFDAGMQPDTLSALALGVIANARGTVTGRGRVDWTARDVTSTGSFATDGLDFAAAFGSTRGLRGTVEFSDLIGVVTRPDQRLQIASINPGIAVEDGTVSFQLQGNNVLAINGARWPFMGGTLELLPSRMVLGAAEVRRYTLRLRGADAALFVQRLDLGNLAASGTFDGDIPLVFDQDGGHVVGGALASRAPGGNVSYVGALTYKDLSPMANFAFQSLRSLDYQRMEIGLDGNLDGEIVTRLRFSGVSQGVGAQRNIATRAIRGLPIQFNVNIRAPFQKLIASFKSMYDPNYIIDPRTLGLVGQDRKAPPVAPPTAPAGASPRIQPPDSRNRP